MRFPEEGLFGISLIVNGRELRGDCIEHGLNTTFKIPEFEFSNSKKDKRNQKKLLNIILKIPEPHEKIYDGVSLLLLDKNNICTQLDLLFR